MSRYNPPPLPSSRDSSKYSPSHATLSDDEAPPLPTMASRPPSKVLGSSEAKKRLQAFKQSKVMSVKPKKHNIFGDDEDDSGRLEKIKEKRKGLLAQQTSSIEAIMREELQSKQNLISLKMQFDRQVLEEAQKLEAKLMTSEHSEKREDGEGEDLREVLRRRRQEDGKDEEKIGGRDRGPDASTDMDQSRERSSDKEQAQDVHEEEDRIRAQSRDKSKTLDRSFDEERSRDRSSDKHNSQDRSSDKHRSRDKSGDRHRARDRSGDRHRARNGSADRHRARDKSSDRHRARDRSADRHRARDRSGDKHRVRDKSSDRHQARDRSGDNNRSRDKSADEYHARDKSSDGDRSYDKKRTRDKSSDNRTRVRSADKDRKRDKSIEEGSKRDKTAEREQENHRNENEGEDEKLRNGDGAHKNGSREEGGEKKVKKSGRWDKEADGKRSAQSPKQKKPEVDDEAHTGESDHEEVSFKSGKGTEKKKRCDEPDPLAAEKPKHRDDERDDDRVDRDRDKSEPRDHDSDPEDDDRAGRSSRGPSASPDPDDRNRSKKDSSRSSSKKKRRSEGGKKAPKKRKNNDESLVTPEKKKDKKKSSKKNRSKSKAYEERDEDLLDRSFSTLSEKSKSEVKTPKKKSGKKTKSKTISPKEKKAKKKKNSSKKKSPEPESEGEEGPMTINGELWSLATSEEDYLAIKPEPRQLKYISNAEKKGSVWYMKYPLSSVFTTETSPPISWSKRVSPVSDSLLSTKALLEESVHNLKAQVASKKLSKKEKKKLKKKAKSSKKIDAKAALEKLEKITELIDKKRADKDKMEAAPRLSKEGMSKLYSMISGAEKEKDSASKIDNEDKVTSRPEAEVPISTNEIVGEDSIGQKTRKESGQSLSKEQEDDTLPASSTPAPVDEVMADEGTDMVTRDSSPASDSSKSSAPSEEEEEDSTTAKENLNETEAFESSNRRRSSSPPKEVSAEVRGTNLPIMRDHRSPLTLEQPQRKWDDARGPKEAHHADHGNHDDSHTKPALYDPLDSLFADDDGQGSRGQERDPKHSKDGDKDVGNSIYAKSEQGPGDKDRTSKTDSRTDRESDDRHGKRESTGRPDSRTRGRYPERGSSPDGRSSNRKRPRESARTPSPSRKRRHPGDGNDGKYPARGRSRSPRDRHGQESRSGRKSSPVGRSSEDKYRSRRDYPSERYESRDGLPSNDNYRDHGYSDRRGKISPRGHNSSPPRRSHSPRQSYRSPDRRERSPKYDRPPRDSSYRNPNSSPRMSSPYDRRASPYHRPSSRNYSPRSQRRRSQSPYGRSHSPRRHRSVSRERRSRSPRVGYAYSSHSPSRSEFAGRDRSPLSHYGEYPIKRNFPSPSKLSPESFINMCREHTARRRSPDRGPSDQYGYRSYDRSSPARYRSRTPPRRSYSRERHMSPRDRRYSPGPRSTSPRGRHHDKLDPYHGSDRSPYMSRPPLDSQRPDRAFTPDRYRRSPYRSTDDRRSSPRWSERSPRREHSERHQQPEGRPSERSSSPRFHQTGDGVPSAVHPSVRALSKLDQYEDKEKTMSPKRISLDERLQQEHGITVDVAQQEQLRIQQQLLLQEPQHQLSTDQQLPPLVQAQPIAVGLPASIPTYDSISQEGQHQAPMSETERVQAAAHQVTIKLMEMQAAKEAERKKRREQRIAERQQAVMSHSENNGAEVEQKVTSVAPTRILDQLEQQEQLTEDLKADKKKKKDTNATTLITLKPFYRPHDKKGKKKMELPLPVEEEEEEEELDVPRSPVPLPDNSTCKSVLVKFGFGVTARPEDKRRTGKKQVQYRDGVRPGQFSPSHSSLHYQKPNSVNPANNKVTGTKKYKKIRLQVVTQHVGDTDSEDERAPPPPPPPGSPPRYHTSELLAKYGRPKLLSTIA